MVFLHPKNQVIFTVPRALPSSCSLGLDLDTEADSSGWTTRFSQTVPFPSLLAHLLAGSMNVCLLASFGDTNPLGPWALQANGAVEIRALSHSHSTVACV